MTAGMWHGPRTAEWAVELLDLNGNHLDERLPLKAGAGTLDWQGDRTGTGTGSVTVQGDIDAQALFLGRRLRPVYILNGVRYPQGVFNAVRTPTSYSGEGQTRVVSLADAAIITGNTVGSLTLPAATRIADQVHTLITAAGKSANVAASDATLRTEMSWPDNTPTQKVVDDLLGAAGFTPLRPDNLGGLSAALFTPPSERLVAYDFRNDATGIYKPVFNIDTNWTEIPNRVRAVARSSSTAASITGYALDENPSSPWSYQNRGEWVEAVVTDVDAASQDAANLIAAQRLAELQQAAATLQFQCAWIPALGLGAVVGFHHSRHGLSGLWEITEMSWAMTPTALVSVTARSVA